MSPTPSLPSQPCQHGGWLCSLCVAEAARPVTFRVVRWHPSSRFMGMAWDDAIGVFVSTATFGTYAEARQALDVAARDAGVSLRWFDGSYAARVIDGGVVMSPETSGMSEGVR